jgi:hypothetical protein
MVSGVLWSPIPTSPFTTRTRPRRASTARPIVVISAGSSTSVRTGPAGAHHRHRAVGDRADEEPLLRGEYATPSAARL